MTDHEIELRAFWREVYIATMKTSVVELAAEYADQALLDYDSRFSPVEEPTPTPLPEVDLDLLG